MPTCLVCALCLVFSKLEDTETICSVLLQMCVPQTLLIGFLSVLWFLQLIKMEVQQYPSSNAQGQHEPAKP